MFCFDNSFSSVSEKIIFFELILDNMEDEGEEADEWKEYVHGTDMLDMKLEDIMVSPRHLVPSQQHQGRGAVSLHSWSVSGSWLVLVFRLTRLFFTCQRTGQG